MSTGRLDSYVCSSKFVNLISIVLFYEYKSICQKSCKAFSETGFIKLLPNKVVAQIVMMV